MPFEVLRVQLVAGYGVSFRCAGDLARDRDATFGKDELVCDGKCPHSAIEFPLTDQTVPLLYTIYRAIRNVCEGQDDSLAGKGEGS